MVPRNAQDTNESGERLTCGLFCSGAGSLCYCLHAVFCGELDFAGVGACGWKRLQQES